MEIRILKPEDAKEYLTIRLEALQNNPEAFSSSYEEEKKYSIEKYEERFSGDTSYTIGAFENNLLVGVISIVREQRVKIYHRTNIYATYVKPENRRHGVASKLLESAINKIKEWDGVEQVYLSVVTTNDAAKRLYQNTGFKTYGVDKHALKVNGQYYDEELMVLSVR
ncbi:GNAT family N-acetyltransferase [Ornithinibacillus halophilus]|uniref:Protein N-acetyltransferase, RimJ/RimL family n=1 Tax=Ornithinibacillus halophilus TaxID=930117 RepID=A0A1M5LL58_9BACI|nr:GNAT family N-acetyltransferase [Ornithinibacillus halophilus]SHG65745.1 Protein N-acetyltransferase, RimJ/RimL family [Ornithinibacillus halophilus]